MEREDASRDLEAMNAYSHHVGFDLPRRPASREERRSTDLCGWFKRFADESFWNFRITNLSYGGCRFETDAPLVRGEVVKLCIPKRGNLEGAIRWGRGHAFGLSFRIQKPKLVMWPRKAQRHEFDATVMLRRVGRRSQMIEAKDVSLHGCCLRVADLPKVDELMWVKLPGLEALESTVCWVEGFDCGVKFKTSIYPAVFELLLAGKT